MAEPLPCLFPLLNNYVCQFKERIAVMKIHFMFRPQEVGDIPIHLRASDLVSPSAEIKKAVSISYIVLKLQRIRL